MRSEADDSEGRPARHPCNSFFRRKSSLKDCVASLQCSIAVGRHLERRSRLRLGWSPSGIEQHQSSPTREHASSTHFLDRVGRMPRAWNAAKPAIVLLPPIEPDYRSGEHLLRRRHRAVVGSPPFHASRVHRVGVVVVPARANGMMMSSGAVACEQRRKRKPLDRSAKMIVERCETEEVARTLCARERQLRSRPTLRWTGKHGREGSACGGVALRRGACPTNARITT